MRKQNRAGHKESGFLILLLVPILLGMTKWDYRIRVDDKMEIKCTQVFNGECIVKEYRHKDDNSYTILSGEPIEEVTEPTEPTEPECIPTWCNLPIQSCDLPPLTGGTDSCGNPCSKPSPEFPNCTPVEGDNN